ncbi:MAG: hypothetical protein IJK74_08080 [Bacteroidales bacterium]|nr:hypothetical protein [Bacteroidales bacterium]
MEKNRLDILEDERMKQVPFTTPEKYFESLEDRIAEKVFPSEKKGWWTSLGKVLKPALTLAASFLIVAGLGWGVMRLTQTARTDLAQNIDNTEEGQMLDSLVKDFGAIEVNRLFADYEDISYDIQDYDDSDDADAIEEYITLMAPSFPGLLAEELSK